MGMLRSTYNWLMSTDGFRPRAACDSIPDWLRNLHSWCDEAIWLAYIAIPSILLSYVLIKRKKVDFTGTMIGICFAVFIFGFGYGHHVESTLFVTPTYRWAGFVKLFTAITSWFTVLAVIYATPKVFTFIERTSELRQREHELADFFEHAPIGLHKVGADGIIQWANLAELEMLGFELDEYIGHHIADFHSNHETIADILNRLTGGEVLRNRHTQLRRKDGTLRDVLISSNVFRKNGQFGHTRCFTRDVTEVVAISDALKKSEEQFRALADNIPQLAWMARPDGYIYWYNRRWYDYTGRTPKEMEGWGWQSTHDPDVLPLVMERWQASIDGGEQFNMEFPLRGSNGIFCQFLTRVAPVRDLDGRITHWFGTNTDISDRLRIEQDVLHAKEKAEAADLAKSQFLAVLSHEMRTPLTPCLLIASSLGESETVPDDIRIEFQKIRRNLELEARLIDDLLDVMLITKGKMSFHPEVIDIHHKVDLALEICHTDLVDKQIKVEKIFEATQRHVSGDPARMQQVFWNLIKNAVKFTPKGGKITVRSYNENERIVVEVTDNGIGMTADVIPIIFEPFIQAEQTLARRYGGLGLGLAISKSIIERHHGTLVGKSDGPGQGSTFVVRLDTTYVRTIKPLQLEEPAEKPLRILYVEDDVATMDVMAKLLRLSGHVVVTAECVKDAVAINDSKYDLLLSDIGLPDGTGFEVMANIKAACGDRVPGIALTGFGSEDDIKMCYEVGFCEHITKPINFPRLEATIRRVMSR